MQLAEEQRHLSGAVCTVQPNKDHTRRCIRYAARTKLNELSLPADLAQLDLAGGRRRFFLLTLGYKPSPHPEIPTHTPRNNLSAVLLRKQLKRHLSCVTIYKYL